eukprot:TRINITY_DN8767_c0_g1_i1.p1 TRINITY_DN8767_c0_g1~~TRINITY_DN8767_c0_g1_i1.p1  ORF type:complete len:517 (-),score=131.21 TRINITY_DN8767_c0_g1_i1:79-1581(-)
METFVIQECDLPLWIEVEVCGRDLLPRLKALVDRLVLPTLQLLCTTIRASFVTVLGRPGESNPKIFLQVTNPDDAKHLFQREILQLGNVQLRMRSIRRPLRLNGYPETKKPMLPSSHMAAVKDIQPPRRGEYHVVTMNLVVFERYMDKMNHDYVVLGDPSGTLSCSAPPSIIAPSMIGKSYRMTLLLDDRRKPKPTVLQLHKEITAPTETSTSKASASVDAPPPYVLASAGVVVWHSPSKTVLVLKKMNTPQAISVAYRIECLLSCQPGTLEWEWFTLDRILDGVDVDTISDQELEDASQFVNPDYNRREECLVRFVGGRIKNDLRFRRICIDRALMSSVMKDLSLRASDVLSKRHSTEFPTFKSIPSNSWTLPMGQVDHWMSGGGDHGSLRLEKPWEAAERELREEAGITLSGLKDAPMILFPKFNESPWALLQLYLLVCKGPSPPTVRRSSRGEFVDDRWVPVEEDSFETYLPLEWVSPIRDLIRGYGARTPSIPSLK